MTDPVPLTKRQRLMPATIATYAPNTFSVHARKTRLRDSSPAVDVIKSTKLSTATRDGAFRVS